MHAGGRCVGLCIANAFQQDSCKALKSVKKKQLFPLCVRDDVVCKSFPLICKRQPTRLKMESLISRKTLSDTFFLTETRDSQFVFELG